MIISLAYFSDAGPELIGHPRLDHIPVPLGDRDEAFDLLPPA